jgi:ketosteroid isomerase-like protein
MGRDGFVREMWEAWSSGDFDKVAAALTPDARWLAVEQGPWDCDDRAQMLRVMRENRARTGGPAGRIEEITDLGERTLVGFRPDAPPDPDGWPLDNGIRYVVLTFRDGLVSEMKGAISRQVALDYAAAATP